MSKNPSIKKKLHDAVKQHEDKLNKIEYRVKRQVLVKSDIERHFLAIFLVFCQNYLTIF